jgi:hypothetical protein
MSGAAVKNMGRPPQVREAQFKLREHAIQDHVYVAPHGIELEAMLDPRYWASVAYKCKRNDFIEVFGEDGSFYAKYIVLGVETHSVQVARLEYHALDKLETKSDASSVFVKEDDYLIEFEGKNKWKCLRKSDKVMMFSGFDSKKSAEEELKRYLSRLV